MHYKCMNKLLYCPKYLRAKYNGSQHLNVLFYHCSEESHEELPSHEWYERAFPKVTKLSHLLKNVNWIDGRLVNVTDGSIITDGCIEHKMDVFKSLARAFIGSPSMQQALKKKAEAPLAATGCIPTDCFSRPSQREPMILNSLTKICNYLNVSAQQRKSVRLKICPQVTQHRIWTGALEEILKELKSEMESLDYQSPRGRSQLGEQIVSSCLRFLDETSISYDPDSASWMRLTPTKKANNPASRRWGDVLEMFNDLTKCLKSEKGILYNLSKLEVMKEGLFQIKDVLVDRDIGYKEARHQESLVQKKLSKNLGHSSQCLFTLLQYYLYGSVRDMEVEICGGVYGVGGGDRFCLCIGKVLTSDEGRMVCGGMKQLDRALGLFKFVWETAEMKGALELQGHLWCVGAEDRTLTYKGNVFFLHGISL